MRSSLFAVASAIAAVSAQGIQPAPSATVVAAPGTLALGAECASTEQCANGAECFASTAWQIKSCGKFNAACSSDSQCATNTCNNGLCNGFLSSSSSSAPSSASSASGSAATGGIQPAPSSTVVAAAGSLSLGAECASTEQCANGAQCFASTAWQIKSCGKFNAACSSDSQCATNTCNNGLCNGFLSSSSSSAIQSSASSSTATQASGSGIQPAPSATIIAPANSLPLGAECANTTQCANGAECFASTAWQIKSCGKFNAACTSDSQCATNTCNNGLCNGFLPSSAVSARVSSTPTAASNGTSAGASQTRSATPSAYTGGSVSRFGVEGTLAVVFAALAWVV